MDKTSSRECCCFCGKTMDKSRDFHNPYPLREGNLDCCNECNGSYVIPARRTLFTLSKQEQEDFLVYVKQMDPAEIRKALDQEVPASAFLAYIDRCKKKPDQPFWKRLLARCTAPKNKESKS